MRLLLLVVPVWASLAIAQEPALEAVRGALHTYYRGERLAAVPFAAAGAGGLVAGSLLLAGGGDLGRGAGWVNLGFGALEFVAGLVLALGTPGRVASLDALLTKDPAEFLQAERARVTRLTTRFQPALLAVWGAAGVAGGVLAGVGAGAHDDVMLGVGLALAVQGLVMFLLDWAVLDRELGYGSVLRLP